MLEKNMRWMTFASIASLVFFSYLSVSLTALSHILILIPGFYFLYQSFVKKEFKLSASGWALFLLIMISFISVLINPIPLKKISSLKYYLLGGILAVFAYRDNFAHYFSEKKIKVLLHAFFLIAAFASLIGIIALYTGYNPIKMKPAAHATRASGMYGMYMTYGYGIGFLLICSLGLLVYSKRVQKYLDFKWHLLTFIINFAGLILSATRGALLGFIIAAPLLFWEKGKKWVIGTYLAGALGLLAIVFGTQFGHDLFFERSASNEQRVSQYKASFYAMKESPLFGIGFKNFEANSVRIKKEHNIEWSDFGGHAHNNFLEQMASTGLLGLLALILFVFFWAKEMLARKDLVGLISFSFIVYFVSSGMVQYTFGDGENVFVIMFIYALGQVVPRVGMQE